MLGIGDRGWGQAFSEYTEGVNIVLQLRTVLNQYASIGRCLGIMLSMPLQGQTQGVNDEFAECVFTTVCSGVNTALSFGPDTNWTNIIILSTIDALWGGVPETGYGGLCGGLFKKLQGAEPTAHTSPRSTAHLTSSARERAPSFAGAFAVRRDGLLTEAEGPGDLAVGGAGRDAAHDVRLALRELRRAARVGVGELAGQGGEEPGGHVVLAAVDCQDGVDELGLQRRLRHVTRAARREEALDVLGVLVHREGDEARGRSGGRQLGEGGDAAATRQREVEEHDVGA